MNIYIKAIKTLENNYAWILQELNKPIIIVDPGSSLEVIKYLRDNNKHPEIILITHKHYDHINGVKDLLDIYPNILVYSAPEAIPFLNINKKNIIEISNGYNYVADYRFNCILTPGHTLGHYCFLYKNLLFSGDCIFHGGCGRVFDGTMQQMFNSINKLKQLHNDTMVLCGHNYTIQNYTFAKNILDESYHEKINNFLESYDSNNPISTIRVEKEINPFFIVNNIDEFIRIRELKDRF